MSVTTLDSRSAAFLAALPEPARLAARTLLHAWEMGGGQLRVGQHVARLAFRHRDAVVTAAAVHAAPPRLEFARVILLQHGLDEAAWAHWSDDLADLAAAGFDAHAKFPAVALDRLTPADVARLATNLRDLARLVQPPAR